MAKAPAFQFYPDDFLRDTLELSVAARGCWITLLCKMWCSVTPGRISWPIVGYARTFGSTVEQAEKLIDELRAFGVCDADTDGHGNVTLTNRRMFRDGEEREAARIRQSRRRRGLKDEDEHDLSRDCHADVTPPSSSSDFIFSLHSSEDDLKRLIDACVRANVGLDARLVEIAVLETLVTWRRGEARPIRSAAYFQDEIVHNCSRVGQLERGEVKGIPASKHPVDTRLGMRRHQAARLLFGGEGGGSFPAPPAMRISHDRDVSVTD